MSLVKTIELRFCEGSSDKVYIANIVKEGSFYSVPCEYGRRGSTLKSAHKGTFANLSQANDAFDAVVLQKTRKGYVVFSESESPAESSKEPVFVSSEDSKECDNNSREEALARLKACSVW